MKKVLSIILFATLLLTACFTLASCDSVQEKKVMTLSCNPSIEFVLDEHNVVISATATNEEGNLILQVNATANGTQFDGKSAEDAAKLFVEISNDLGFVVSGDATAKGGNVSISFSGDASVAKQLFEKSQAKINEYLSKENITVAINQAQAISKEHLEQLVASVSPYLEEAKIKAMEYAQLVEEINNAHKETAKMYSQELKNAYYQAKADALEKAKMETLKGHLGTLEKIAVDVTMGLYDTAVKTLESTRKIMLVDENSIYQIALSAFRKAKTEYLRYRKQVEENTAESENAEQVAQTLARLDSAVQSAESALLSAGETANQAIDTAKAKVATLKDEILGAISKASIDANQFVNEISERQQASIQTFTTNFETAYATAITNAKNSWAQMQNDLNANNQ